MFTSLTSRRDSVTTATPTYTLFWLRADRQADMNMGSFPSREAAEAAIPAAKAELLAECCGDDEQRAAIEAGTLSIDGPESE